jgi:hypothetical protein
LTTISAVGAINRIFLINCFDFRRSDRHFGYILTFNSSLYARLHHN